MLIRIWPLMWTLFSLVAGLPSLYPGPFSSAHLKTTKDGQFWKWNPAPQKQETKQEKIKDKSPQLNVNDKDSPYALINKYFPERISYYYQNKNKFILDYNKNGGKDDIGLLLPDEVWLSDGKLLVLKGGSTPDRNGFDNPWEPLDNYEAPYRKPVLPPSNFNPDSIEVQVVATEDKIEEHVIFTKNILPEHSVKKTKQNNDKDYNTNIGDEKHSGVVSCKETVNPFNICAHSDPKKLIADMVNFHSTKLNPKKSDDYSYENSTLANKSLYIFTPTPRSANSPLQEHSQISTIKPKYSTIKPISSIITLPPKVNQLNIFDHKNENQDSFGILSNPLTVTARPLKIKPKTIKLQRKQKISPPKSPKWPWTESENHLKYNTTFTNTPITTPSTFFRTISPPSHDYISKDKTFSYNIPRSPKHLAPIQSTPPSRSKPNFHTSTVDSYNYVITSTPYVYYPSWKSVTEKTLNPTTVKLREQYNSDKPYSIFESLPENIEETDILPIFKDFNFGKKIEDSTSNEVNIEEKTKVSKLRSRSRKRIPNYRNPHKRRRVPRRHLTKKQNFQSQNYPKQQKPNSYPYVSVVRRQGEGDVRYISFFSGITGGSSWGYSYSNQ